jgi:hypothetical protein
MTDARLEEIRNHHKAALARFYGGNGLCKVTPDEDDRDDLLFEVDRLRAEHAALTHERDGLKAAQDGLARAERNSEGWIADAKRYSKHAQEWRDRFEVERAAHEVTKRALAALRQGQGEREEAAFYAAFRMAYNNCGEPIVAAEMDVDDARARYRASREPGV